MNNLFIYSSCPRYSRLVAESAILHITEKVLGMLAEFNNLCGRGQGAM